MGVTFLILLAGGMIFVSAVGPLEKMSWKFLRLVGFLAFALSCFATVWMIREKNAELSFGDTWAAILGGVLCLSSAWCAMFAPIAERRRWSFRMGGIIGGLAGLGAVSIAGWSGDGLEGFGRGVFGMVLGVVDLAAAGFLLGGITVAWLLGHAYLTATTMTIAPLRFYSRLLLWAIAGRVTFVVISMALGYALMGRTDGGENRLLTLLVDSWLIASLRFGVGLVAVGVFAYMVADCVRLRSTQSATGILYFGSVFAYVGELAGRHLTLQLGWPV